MSDDVKGTTLVGTTVIADNDPVAGKTVKRVVFDPYGAGAFYDLHRIEFTDGSALEFDGGGCCATYHEAGGTCEH